MQVKTVSITYGRKFNLQDYNSANIEVSAWADVEEGEDSRAAIDALFAEAKDAVKAQAEPLVHKMTAAMREVFAGLPKDLQEATE